MSAEPLSREEREAYVREAIACGEEVPVMKNPMALTLRWDATVQAAEADMTIVRNALAALDGHTCHEGHTDADHLAMHRAVLAEVRAALEGAS